MPLNAYKTPVDAPHANTIVCARIAYEYKKSSGNIIILFKKYCKYIFTHLKYNNIHM